MRWLVASFVLLSVALLGPPATAQEPATNTPTLVGLAQERVTAIGQGRDGPIVGGLKGTIQVLANGELDDLRFCDDSVPTKSQIQEVRFIAADSESTEWIVTAARLIWRGANEGCFSSAVHPRSSDINDASLLDGNLIAFWSDGQQTSITRTDGGNLELGPLTPMPGHDVYGVIDVNGARFHWGSDWIVVDGQRIETGGFDFSKVHSVFAQGTRVFAATSSGLFTIEDAKLTRAEGWPADTGIEAVEVPSAAMSLSGGRSVHLVGIANNGGPRLIFEVMSAGQVRQIADSGSMDLATAIAMDREGVLWIGTKRGVYRWTSQRHRLTDSTDIANSGSITSVEALVADELVAGENRILLNTSPRADNSSWTPIDSCHDRDEDATSVPSDRDALTAVSFDDDYLLGYSTGAIRVRIAQRCFDEQSVGGRSSQEIADADAFGTALIVTGDDSLFAAAPGEIWIFEPVEDPTGVPTSLYRDSAGTLWVASEDGRASSNSDESLTNVVAVLTESSGRETTAVQHESKKGLVWVGTSDGLFLVDSNSDEICDAATSCMAPPATCKGPAFGCAHFTVEDGLPSNDVNDLDYGADGLWIGTSRGIAVDADAGLAPALLTVTYKCDKCGTGSDSLTDGRRQITVPWDADVVTLTTVLSDTGDWGGNQSILNGDQPEADGINHVLEVAAGVTYELSIVTIDRHFNKSEPIPLQVVVEATPLGERAQSPFFVAPLIAIVAGSLFFLWRCAGRASLRKAELKIYPSGDGYASQLLIAPRVLGKWRKLTELASHDGPIDLTQLRFETGHDATTHTSQFTEEHQLHQLAPRLLSSFLGESGAEALLAETRRRKRIRLGIVQPPALRWLPWELLGSEGEHVTATRGLTLMRLVKPVEDELPRLDGPIRILAVRCGTGPDGNLEKPFEDQLAALRAGFEGATIVEHHIDADNEDTLDSAESPLADDWDIIHVCGHGQTDESGRASIAVPSEGKRRLRGPQTSERHVKSGEWARSIQGQPRLVTFAACRTSSPAPSDEHSAGLAEHLVESGTCSFSVGFAYDVQLPNLTKLLHVFYDSLGASGQVDVALNDAQVALGPKAKASTDSPDTGKASDWAGARLYANRPSGYLYERR